MSLYRFESKYAWVLKRIENSDKIDADTKAKIKEFLDHVKVLGTSTGRQLKYANPLYNICIRLNKPAKECTRKDIEDLVKSLMEGFSHNGEKKKYSPFTMNDYAMAIKRFWKFIKYGNVDKDTPYPEEVRWLKKTVKLNESKKAEFLTPKEVERMMEVASSLRDKAMISVAFEAGLRTGELLLMNVGDVSFDEYGARIKLRGKTVYPVYRATKNEQDNEKLTHTV